MIDPSTIRVATFPGTKDTPTEIRASLGVSYTVHIDPEHPDTTEHDVIRMRDWARDLLWRTIYGDKLLEKVYHLARLADPKYAEEAEEVRCEVRDLLNPNWSCVPVNLAKPAKEVN